MGTNEGAVDEQALQVGGVGQVLMELGPDAAPTPAGKALVDTVPTPILAGQQAPLRTAAHHPQHGLDEASAVGFVAHIYTGSLSQAVVNLIPLIVTQFYLSHAAILLHDPKCQQNLGIKGALLLKTAAVAAAAPVMPPNCDFAVGEPYEAYWLIGAVRPLQTTLRGQNCGSPFRVMLLHARPRCNLSGDVRGIPRDAMDL